eukprot:g37924.t1
MKKAIGGASKCPRCTKSVYAAEEKLACGKSWHDRCFRCKECGTGLDNQTLRDNNGEIYCDTCHSKLFGPKGFGIGSTSVHTGVNDSRSSPSAASAAPSATTSAASSSISLSTNPAAARAAFQQVSRPVEAEPIPSTGQKKKKPTFGGGDKCPRCGRTVYDAERCSGAGKSFHRECFRCKTCGDGLDATTLADNAGEIYCKKCYGKQFGPKGFGIGGGIVHTK